MSADALDIPMPEGGGDEVKDAKSGAVDAVGEQSRQLSQNNLIQEEAKSEGDDSQSQSRRDSGAGSSGGGRKGSGAGAGTGKEERKESLKRTRRVSMFDDKTTKLQDGSVTGELKETLAEYFSTGTKDSQDTSTALKPLRRPKLVYENTYRMDSSHPFVSSRVQKSIQNIVDDMLMDFKYNSKTSAPKAMEVAEKIRRNVLAFRFERYKICVLVTIAPLNRQGFYNGFRCLWDANRDSYAVATLRNPSIFAIAVVYGIYFE